MKTRFTAVYALLLAWPLHGCAAIPVAAVAGGLFEAGGGALVKTGTEYTASGTALRTFRIPIHDVHTAALEACDRTAITVRKDEWSSKGTVIVGEAEHRMVHIELIRLTPMLTSMELVVKRNLLASDKATASELLAQTELVLTEKQLLTVRAADATGRP
jgi:hypothetical protein